MFIQLTRLAINGRIIGRLVASLVIILTITSLLGNGQYEYPQTTVNILMLILGGAVTILFSKPSE